MTGSCSEHHSWKCGPDTLWKGIAVENGPSMMSRNQTYHEMVVFVAKFTRISNLILTVKVVKKKIEKQHLSSDPRYCPFCHPSSERTVFVDGQNTDKHGLRAKQKPSSNHQGSTRRHDISKSSESHCLVKQNYLILYALQDISLMSTLTQTSTLYQH